MRNVNNNFVNIDFVNRDVIVISLILFLFTFISWISLQAACSVFYSGNKARNMRRGISDQK